MLPPLDWPKSKVFLILCVLNLWTISLDFVQSNPITSTKDSQNLQSWLNSLPKESAPIPGAYLVEYNAPSRQEGTRAKQEAGMTEALQERAHASFLKFVNQAQRPVKVLRRYRDLWSGIAVQVSDKDRESLSQLGVVKAIYPILRVPSAAPTPKTPTGKRSKVMEAAHNLTQVNLSNFKFGVSGKGIKVGIIHTGIDWQHPAFALDGAECKTLGGPGCRVTGGYDFSGDDYGGSGPNGLIPVPDEDPMDCNGHGTHVAGIVGGKDSYFVGVAPKVTFTALKIFGCTGSTDTSLIMAAMERAFSDGMDIINMSLGGAPVHSDYPTARMADALVNEGMLVVAAASNKGSDGLFQVSAPGISSKAIAVASVDNSSWEEI